MKVGVDSVLLGAWTEADHVVRILDVGAGTGLLTLMMAQRFSEALIDAVEIDREACQQTEENVTNSVWNNRIRIICADFADYVDECTFRYNIIISNPPYFTASLKPRDQKRNIARHNDSLPHSLLLAGSAKLLTSTGVLAVVLPTAEALSLIDESATYNLFVKRTLHIQTVPSKAVYRMLVELTKAPSSPYFESSENRLCIENADRLEYTDTYKELTKDFYLKF